MSSELLSIVPLLCSRARSRRSTCTLCRDVCPHDAVSLGQRAPEIGSGCTGCGLCVAACLNGAIDLVGSGEDDLIAAIQSRGQTSGTVGFTCQCGQTQGYIRVPCLGRLGEHHLLAPFAFGVEGVSIEKIDCCRGCTYEKGWTLFLETMGRAQKICKARITFMDGSPLPRPPSQGMSRRGFFAAISRRLRGTYQNGEGSHFLDRGVNRKREILLGVVQGIAKKGVDWGDISQRGTPFGDISISTECFGCVVCDKLCPTRAVVRNESESEIVLSFDPALCTGCRLCVEACLPEAVSIKERFDLALLLAARHGMILRLDKVRCSLCGEEFGSSGGVVCPRCRKKVS